MSSCSALSASGPAIRFRRGQTILTEILANALDAGASHIRVERFSFGPRVWQVGCRPNRRGYCELPSRHQSISELSYLDAACVNSPAGVLSEFAVVTASGEQLGRITGVVIDAGARRARYLDVQSRGLRRRRYLVEADESAQVDSERKQLRLLSAQVCAVHHRRSQSFRPFSEKDLLAALFSSRAA